MNDNQSKLLMLIFTIGPAQSFIEAARKTEDMWMGSYILSYLTATAMEKIQGDGVELIYPAIKEQSPFEFWEKQDPTTPSIPNLFLAIGDGNISQDDLAERAKEGEKAVNIEFKSMARRVLDEAFKISGNWRDSYVKDLFKNQINNFFDVYWVITQEKSGQVYGDWYKYTASSLAAIKNCRAFKQVPEFGRKCSLDGTREILHLEENESIEQAMKWWADFAKRTPRHCREKEALCAVSLTKRMGRHYLENYSRFKDEFKDKSERPRFPSTSEVATAAFKEQLRCKPNALGVYAEFVKEVKKLKDRNNKNADIPDIRPLPKISDFLELNIDGEWLYEETYNDSYLERYYNIDASKQRDQIEQCKKLRKKLVRILEGEPGKYYAAIALDADNMGEVNRKAKNKKEHESNSTQLIDFTKDARRIVEKEHLGKLTYAGGDDLLALANIRNLLPILKKLHKAFPDDLTTISAGVCIAHNKMPLTNVIMHARNMEKAAKNDGGRNALGIALYKHSGNVSQVVTKWEYGNLDVLNISQELIQLLDNDVVSKRFIYNFRDVITQLLDDDGDISDLPSALVNEEFKRLIDSAYKDIGKELDNTHLQTLDKTIELWAYIIPFTQFLSFLDIISFIARESK